MKKKNGIRMWMNIHLNLRWKQVILALVMIVVGIGAGILNGKVSMHKNIYHSVVLFVSSSLLISFGVILFSMLLPQIAVLKNMGSQTMLCLALHIPMIRLVQYYSSNSYSFYINHPFLLSICTIVLLMIICHIYSWLHFRILSKKISLWFVNTIELFHILNWCGIINFRLFIAQSKLFYLENKDRDIHQNLFCIWFD